ncbi:MAG: hypothetical protein K6G11_02015 [Lachnospiraceae bacterium]|nr:hypothetical protein [Lachnospiraceae bacterium]
MKDLTKKETLISGESVIITGIAGLSYAGLEARRLIKKPFERVKTSLLNENILKNIIDKRISFFENLNQHSDLFYRELSKEEDAVFEFTDVSIYDALWEFAAFYNKGILIKHERFMIPEDLIEFYEYVDENPFLCEDERFFIIASKTPDMLMDKLDSYGIYSQVIGYVNKSKDRKVVVGNQERFLTPVRK